MSIRPPNNTEINGNNNINAWKNITFIAAVLKNNTKGYFPEKVFHSKTLGRIHRKFCEVVFKVTHFTSKKRIEGVKKDLAFYKVLNEDEKSEVNHFIQAENQKSQDKNDEKNLTKMISSLDTKNYDQAFVQDFISILPNETKYKNLLAEVDACVKGDVSINKKINRYAPVYQDAMCQLITDKYYEKITQEGNAELKIQYYNEYRQFISGIHRKDLKINSKFELLKQEVKKEVKKFIETPITSLAGIKDFLEKTNINKLPTDLREELLAELPESINKDVLTVAFTPYNKINFENSSQLLWMNSEANRSKQGITEPFKFDKIFEGRDFGIASGGKLEARKFIFYNYSLINFTKKQCPEI